jgi:hypothetical protein
MANFEATHDPREFIRGIQQILISGTKRIGFLCGAGTSMATPKTNSDGQIVFETSGDGKECTSGGCGRQCWWFTHLFH